MGVGMIVGGIILLVIGIGAYSYLGGLKNQAEQGLSECQSILGQAGQFLSPEINQKCQQAQQYTPAIQTGYYIGIAFAAIGFILAIVGGIGLAIKSSKNRGKKVETETENLQDDMVFCRYCGTTRPISGEYCPYCGRSSRSTSNSMKTCVNCGTSSGEDSVYCVRCGTLEFRDGTKESVTEKEKDIPVERHGRTNRIHRSAQWFSVMPRWRKFALVAVIVAVALIITFIVPVTQPHPTPVLQPGLGYLNGYAEGIRMYAGGSGYPNKTACTAPPNELPEDFCNGVIQGWTDAQTNKTDLINPSTGLPYKVPPGTPGQPGS